LFAARASRHLLFATEGSHLSIGNKQNAGGEQPAGEFYAELRRKVDEKERAREHARREQWERVRPGLETRKALYAVAWGTDDIKIGLLHERITIDSPTWAGLIVVAATCFKAYPGIQALVQRPLPDSGAGFEAGKRIFGRACAGACVDEIAEEIDRARKMLGPPKGDFNHADSELGLWGFFLQLERFFDGESWSPPGRPGIAKRARDPSALPRSTAPSLEKAQALFNEILARPPRAHVRAPDICKALGKPRQFLDAHVNKGLRVSWNENRLDEVGREADRLNAARLYSKESVLRWLGRTWLTVSDDTLRASGALPALPPQEAR
jgi:hypothetical protein